MISSVFSFQENCQSLTIIGKNHFLNVVYRVSFFQKFEPVPVPEKSYGKFYSGDSYIVLNVSTTHLSFLKVSNVPDDVHLVLEIEIRELIQKSSEVWVINYLEKRRSILTLSMTPK